MEEVSPACILRRPAQKEVFVGTESYFLLGSYHTEYHYGAKATGYTYAFSLGDMVVYREPTSEHIEYPCRIVESKEPFVVTRERRVEDSL